ncbi:MAG: DUF3187 family protein, partial [Candidatus Omnitrophota bacterium]
MRTKITTVLITACFIFTSYCFAYERVNARGPMAIRNQSPLYLFYYFFPQDRADVVKQGKLDTAFDYTVSNVVVDKVTTPTEEYIVRMDMEVERYNLGLKYGVLDRLEVGLEVPYISLSGGYLDSFVEEFEDLIGATPVGARSRASKDQFNYNIQHNNRNLINTREEASGLGDIALCAKYMLVDEGDMGHMPRTSIRGAVKFPTADEDKYLGNGGVDYGLGV